jgi:hypothetical protein
VPKSTKPPTDDEYKAEVRKQRDALHVLRGDAEPEKPKLLSLSQIVELLLTRGSRDQSSVTLMRNASGETLIEVKVRTGDDDDVRTMADVEARAAEVYDRLAAQYPPAREHANAALSLSRNAKGETQIEVKANTSSEGAATLAELEAQVRDSYDSARMAYPMADGHSAKPGSVR